MQGKDLDRKTKEKISCSMNKVAIGTDEEKVPVDELTLQVILIESTPVGHRDPRDETL